MFSLYTSKISCLKWLPEFINSSSMITQICQLLPNNGEPNIYIVYTDNFFTNAKLFKHLKKYGQEVCDTAKVSSRFPAEFLIFCDILSKKNN